MPFDFDFGKLGETLQGKFTEAKDSLMSYFDEQKPAKTVKPQSSKTTPPAKPAAKPRAQRPKLNPLQEKIYGSMQQWTPQTYSQYLEYNSGNMDTNTGNFNNPVPLKSQEELEQTANKAYRMSERKEDKNILGCDRRDNACASAVSLLTRQIDPDLKGHTWTTELYKQLRQHPKYDTHNFTTDNASTLQKLDLLAEPGTYAPGFTKTPSSKAGESENHAYAYFNSGDSLHRFEDGSESYPMQRAAVSLKSINDIRNIMRSGKTFDDAVKQLNITDEKTKVFLNNLFRASPVLHTRRWK